MTKRKINKDVKKYIRNVKLLLPLFDKKKNSYINEIEKQIDEYYYDHDCHSYNDIVTYFGKPNKMAATYIDTMDSDSILEKLNIKKHIVTALAVIVVLALGISILRACYLTDLYNKAKDDINGYDIVEIGD